MPQRNKRRVKRRKIARVSTSLPALEIVPRLVHTYRWQSTNGATYSPAISMGNLLLACGAMCTVAGAAGAGTITTWWSSFRIKRIQMWGMLNPASVNIGTVGIDFSSELAGTSENFSTNLTYSDSTLSTANPAHLDVRPPKGSAASLWHTVTGATLQLANTTILQLIFAPYGVCDITIELVMSNNEGPLISVTPAITAPVLGNEYYLRLDGTSGSLAPVGLNGAS